MLYTFTGNLADAPEVTNTNSGKTVAKLRVICSERYRDSATGEWKSTDAVGWWAEAWDSTAQAIAAAGFKKGEAVIITGDIKDAHWKTQDGESRTRRHIAIRTMGSDVVANARRAGAAPAQVAEAVEAAAEWGDE